nr:MAG TPA: hypothetical protein [Caudoviricetes sp.]
MRGFWTKTNRKFIIKTKLRQLKLSPTSSQEASG